MSNILCHQLPKRLYQTCPLCGSEQGIMMKGLVSDIETGQMKVAFDKGYSFCNCNDIFFTKRENLDSTLYDEFYHKKYQNDDIKTIADFEIKKIHLLLREFHPNAKSVLEVGAVTDYWLDYLKEQGYSVTGMDIMPHESKHEMIVADFDGEFSVPALGYDVILASHVFEHFKKPEEALKTLELLLNPNGLLYIAMPDHYLLDWNDALNWDWNVQEHHTLWTMESFIAFCEKRGWKCLFSERPLNLHKQKQNDLFWKREMQVLLCRT